MVDHISNRRTDPDGLKDLAPLWAGLHRHHREVSDYPALVEDLDSLWARRLRWYRRLLTLCASYVTATDDERRPIGGQRFTRRAAASTTTDRTAGR